MSVPPVVLAVFYVNLFPNSTYVNSQMLFAYALCIVNKPFLPLLTEV